MFIRRENIRKDLEFIWVALPAVWNFRRLIKKAEALRGTPRTGEAFELTELALTEIRKILSAGAARNGTPKDDAELQSAQEMLSTLAGPALLDLGRYTDAIPLLEHAGRAARTQLGSDSNPHGVLRLAIMSSHAHEALGDGRAGADGLGLAIDMYERHRLRARTAVGGWVGSRVAEAATTSDGVFAEALAQLCRLQLLAGDKTSDVRANIDRLDRELSYVGYSRRLWIHAAINSLEGNLLLRTTDLDTYGHNLESAHEQLQKACDFWLSTTKRPSRRRAEVQLDLASCYAAHHRWGDAVVLAEAGTLELEDSLGPHHPALAEATRQVAEYRAASGSPESGLDALLEAAERGDPHLMDVLLVVCERQRLNFLSAARAQLDTILSLQTTIGWTPEAARRIYAVVLRRKGMAYDVAALGGEVLVSHRSPEAAGRVTRLQQLRRLSGELILSGGSAHASAAGEDDPLDAWAREMDEIQSYLGRTALAAGIRQSFEVNRVQRCIPYDSALIEIIRYGQRTQENRQREQRYLAFVLTDSDPDVMVVDLGPAKPLDDAVRSVRRLMNSNQAARARKLEAQLRTVSQNLLEPLMASLAATKRHWLVAPDGQLHNLPLDIVPTKGGAMLLDHHAVSYLATARDLFRTEPNFSIDTTAPLVIGAPAYEMKDHRETKSQAQRFKIELPELLATGEEAIAVGRYLGVPATLGEDATKSAVLHARRPAVVHIATHGYVLEIPPAHLTSREARLEHAQLAMNFSGLALAGAKTYAEGGIPPKRAGNGLLSAHDILTIDLAGTDLVVLSSCASGLGAVVSGEGVFGLRRAFLLAGARSLVVSLWKIPDETTRALMNDFYRQLADGDSVLRALQTAQAAARKRNPDPMTWGGFVLLGRPSTTPMPPPGPVQSRCDDVVPG